MGGTEHARRAACRSGTSLTPLQGKCCIRVALLRGRLSSNVEHLLSTALCPTASGKRASRLRVGLTRSHGPLPVADCFVGGYLDPSSAYFVEKLDVEASFWVDSA